MKRRFQFRTSEPDADQDVREEIDAHLELAVESLLAQGLTEEEARKSAETRFGDRQRFETDAKREASAMECRVRWWTRVESVAVDFRFGIRQLRRRPGFAFLAALMLSLGIGTTGTIFALVDSALLPSLPFPNSDRLTWMWAETDDGSRGSFAYGEYLDYQERTDVFQEIGAYMRFRQTRILIGEDGAKQLVTYRVSPDLFPTLGVPPALGRFFTPQDDPGNERALTIISHRLWLGRFGGDPQIIGTTATMDGEHVEIVGVMPAEFDFPAGAEAWFKVDRNASYASDGRQRNFDIVGRLSDGVSLEAADAELDIIARGIADADRAIPEERGVHIISLSERFYGDARRPILILTAILALVPLVALISLASLLMARGVARRPELAARQALGASRARLMRQFLSEGLVVSLGGAALGLCLAFGTTKILRSSASALVPGFERLGLNSSILVVSLLAAFFLVPLFGWIPACRGTGVRAMDISRFRGGAGTREWRIRRSLLVTQVGLTLMVLLGSGLLFRSFVNLSAVDPGVETENVLALSVLIPSFKFTSQTQSETAWDLVRTKVEALPGVTAVGFCDRTPLSGAGPNLPVYSSKRPLTGDAEVGYVTRRQVSPGYFAALQVPIVAGKVFDIGDGSTDRPVAVINEALASRYFDEEDPLGKTLFVGGSNAVGLEVVGVTADTKEGGLEYDPPPIVFLPVPWHYDMLDVLVRTSGDPVELSETATQAVRQVDADLTVQEVRSLVNSIDESLVRSRFQSTAVGIFAPVVLILSLIGINGALTFFVQERSHEVSIRLALGASYGGITGLVLRQGMGLVGRGIIVGVAGALVGGQILRSLLFGVGASDPFTILIVSASVAACGFVASIIPAVRAMRIDPVAALKLD